VTGGVGKLEVGGILCGAGNGCTGGAAPPTVPAEPNAVEKAALALLRATRVRERVAWSSMVTELLIPRQPTYKQQRLSANTPTRPRAAAHCDVISSHL
jgi:hypothetical protein